MAPQFDRELRELLRTAGCTMVRQGRGSHEIWHSPVTRRNFAGSRSAFPADTQPMPFCARPACPRPSERPQHIALARYSQIQISNSMPFDGNGRSPPPAKRRGGGGGGGGGGLH